MADLEATYMGVKLSNPIIVGACELTGNMDKIKQIEQAGAGAIVTKSLFEEEIDLERFLYDEDQHKFDNRYAEQLRIFPPNEYGGPKQHLMWVRETKKAAGIPVFASLNAKKHETWLEYARLLQETGVDGLECNLFSFPRDPKRKAIDIEDEQIATVTEIVKSVSIPVAVKLSTSYTNTLNMINRLDKAGVAGLVLFNRVFEPDIDVQAEKPTMPLNLSSENDGRISIRYAALLRDKVRASLCCSGGILRGDQIVKMILAGADVIQTVGSLYRYGIPHLITMKERLEEWMTGKGYESLSQFRGKVSRESIPGDPWIYGRSQYAKLLMKPQVVINNAPVI